MFGFKKMGLTTAVAAVMAFSGGFANDTQAATVAFQNGADGGGDTRFTVECSVGCQGWLFDAETLSSTIGGLIDFLDTTYADGEGETWEKNLLASVAGETGLAFSKNEDPDTSYSSNALYQLFKIGKTPNVGVLKNTAGVVQTYSFDQVATGSGLSHISNYGVVAPVPLPAAGLMLITALGGLGFAARRRRKAA
jgi:hypothetical protein